MTARHFAGKKIRNDYIRYVKNFAAFLLAARPMPPPPRTSSVSIAHGEDPREPVDHQRDHRRTPILLLKVTLERDDLVRRLDIGARAAQGVADSTEPRGSGLARLLEAASGAKYLSAALGVAYGGAGLRVSEVVALKVSHQ